MSSIIKILPDHVINKIAAGEVVERPASVVKELIENSIDAGAGEIVIDIEQAGRRLIRVSDDGCGISKDDARTAFVRHATSKITSDEDLGAIRTMGFRGEALSSVASVSRIRLLTAVRGAASGVLLEIEAGKVKSLTDAAAAMGTAVEVSDLFYNTPARLKFLKSPGTEFTHILTAVSRQAMAHPAIRFRLTHNGKKALDLPPSTSVKERAFQLYGGEIAENVLSFAGGRDGVSVRGLIGRPAYTRSDRTYQDFYVNQRAVKNPSLSHALYGAYSGMLMRDRHPVGFVFIEIDPSLVDVNVHPAKTEVRFRNQSQVHDLVRDAVREGLRGKAVLPSSPQAGRIQEAVADYLANAECGVWHAPLTPMGSGSDAHPLPPGNGVEESRDVAVHSATRDPQSEMLYPFGQIHDSFIIAQSSEGMTIIDQHAAHERVLFEKLQDQLCAGPALVQDLLMPVPVELGPAQSSLLSEYAAELHKLGFMVEDFGNGTFMIKAVPALLVGADYRKLLLDVLDEVNVHGRSARMDEVRDELLSVMACHPAIKVNRRLDRKEMEALLCSLFACRMPHTCPHGRPTMVRFSLDELRKWFKRT